MTPKVIKTAADYDAALARINQLMEKPLSQAQGDEFETWVTLVQVYEKDHHPIDLPTPVEAIGFRMEQAGLRQQDLVPYIGSASKVSEVLNGTRQLSLRMIRSLHGGLGIPLKALLQDQPRVARSAS